MVADLIRALLAGAAGAVLPGYFWAAVLRPTSGLGERLAWSTGISMASVPTVAVMLARVTRGGVALWVALASVLIVFGSGLLVYRLRGPAPGRRPRCCGCRNRPETRGFSAWSPSQSPSAC